MRVRLYKTNKRLKSTLQLELDEELNPPVHVFENAHLKEQTDIDFPTFELGGQYFDANYLYVDDWRRYYFIRKYKLGTAKIYEVQCEVDGLASLKEDILGSRQFVLYSSSNYNRWIRDDRTPIIARPPETLLSHSSPTIGEYTVFDDEVVDPLVILATVSQESGLSYWKMSRNSVNHLLDSLTRAGSTIWGALQEQFGDALGSIISAYRLPINSAVIEAGEIEDIYLGSYHVQDGEQSYIQARRLTNTFINFRGRCGIPTGYLDYRVFEPYSRLKLRLPFVGLVDISHEDFAGSVYYQGLVNLLNGKIVWTIYNDENHSKAIATYSGQCGENLPLATSQIQNAESLVNAVAGSTTAAATAVLNPAAGLITGIATVANSFYHLTKETSNLIGSYSGGISEIMSKRVEVVLEKMETAEEPDNLRKLEGRPLMQVVSLENLTGYCRTVNASLQISATAELTRHLEQLLDSGIYIE